MRAFLDGSERFEPDALPCAAAAGHMKRNQTYCAGIALRHAVRCALLEGLSSQLRKATSTARSALRLISHGVMRDVLHDRAVCGRRMLFSGANSGRSSRRSRRRAAWQGAKWPKEREPRRSGAVWQLARAACARTGTALSVVEGLLARDPRKRRKASYSARSHAHLGGAAGPRGRRHVRSGGGLHSAVHSCKTGSLGLLHMI